MRSNEAPLLAVPHCRERWQCILEFSLRRLVSSVFDGTGSNAEIHVLECRWPRIGPAADEVDGFHVIQQQDRGKENGTPVRHFYHDLDCAAIICLSARPMSLSRNFASLTPLMQEDDIYDFSPREAK